MKKLFALLTIISLYVGSSLAGTITIHNKSQLPISVAINDLVIAKVPGGRLELITGVAGSGMSGGVNIVPVVQIADYEGSCPTSDEITSSYSSKKTPFTAPCGNFKLTITSKHMGGGRHKFSVRVN